MMDEEKQRDSLNCLFNMLSKVNGQLLRNNKPSSISVHIKELCLYFDQQNHLWVIMRTAVGRIEILSFRPPPSIASKLRRQNFLRKPELERSKDSAEGCDVALWQTMIPFVDGCPIPLRLLILSNNLMRGGVLLFVLFLGGRQKLGGRRWLLEGWA